MRNSVENPNLKPYIEEYVIKTLESCDLFVNTYGKGFVKKRLEANFKTLYTEGKKNGVAGEYHVGRSGIISIFEKGSDGNLLTFEDLEKRGKLVTALHESIHAIFNKTPEECQSSCIKSGSGIHEIYSNSVEMGRGLNEGYTNWVCEKAGLRTSSYPDLTGFVEILELAIGPENVMKFGEGNIISKLPNLLQMEPEETTFFLSKSDLICDYDYKSSDYKRVASLLNKKNEFRKLQEEDPLLKMPPDLIEDLLELNRYDIYANILDDKNYIQYVNENDLEMDSDETKEMYCKTRAKFYTDKTFETRQEIYEDLLSKYFMKELENIISSKEFSLEQYKKFSRLDSLIYIPDDENNTILSSFKNNYEQLKDMALGKIQEEIKTSMQNKTLTPEQIIEYKDVIVNSDDRKEYDFNRMISEQMLPENPYIYQSFFARLSRANLITQMFDYKILELSTQKGETSNLFLNKENHNHFSNYVQTPTIVNASDEIKENDNLFDITLNGLQSMQEIVRSFLSLKNQICKENPNAKIQIIDSIVLVDKGENTNPEFYMVEGNEIVPANAKELKTQYSKENDKNNNDKTNSQKESSNLKVEEMKVEESPKMEIETAKNSNTTATSLQNISKNPFKRLFMEIKKKLFRKDFNPEPTPVTFELSEEELDKIDMHPKKFDDRIYVDIQQTNSPEKTINHETNIKDDEKNNDELDK